MRRDMVLSLHVFKRVGGALGGGGLLYGYISSGVENLGATIPGPEEMA